MKKTLGEKKCLSIKELRLAQEFFFFLLVSKCSVHGILFCLLFMYVHTCVPSCHSPRMEFRGQLRGLITPYVGSGIECRSQAYMVRAFTY